MIKKKNYISILLIVLSLSLASCKEKQPEQVEIKDKYALPKTYTKGLNSVEYDFEHPSKQLVRIDSEIGKFLGVEKDKYPGNCGFLDFEKKNLQLRITGTKKEFILKVIYLGNYRFAILNQENRGYVGKLEVRKDRYSEDTDYNYYIYPLSDISDEKKVDNLGQLHPGLEFDISNLSDSKYKSIDDCEKEKIEQERVQQSIDEERERVKGDLAPP
ncbi:hypothetical protein CH380_21180 [Leptospira adleri]|uniref:Lipoprotein n=1 Tax=Leptospira adleri TaxID=2023186 RepID=A0A2M9YI59_9LEPT|nr:hypothetical protein [Leptospira adleri]PJZ51231.1 hypothetical protein CH380_21180 [Leptospira adleri]